MNENMKNTVIDQKKVSSMTKRIVRAERDNYIQKEKNDSDIEESIKKIIEGELK